MTIDADARATLRLVLARYDEVHPADRATTARIRALVDAHPDCFSRHCFPGHITTSAFIVSPDLEHCLLTHHRKLSRWLQLGGHVEGECEPHRAALREAIEESGMARFRFFDESSRPLPYDVDVHSIPARPGEPQHDHHDLRYLLIAEPGQSIQVSDESHDVRWFPITAIADRDEVTDESVTRLARRALALLRAR
jgi:8-oxo-dGTP pyrophosphatase MutT (NUDIX family)